MTLNKYFNRLMIWCRVHGQPMWWVSDLVFHLVALPSSRTLESSAKFFASSWHMENEAEHGGLHEVLIHPVWKYHTSLLSTVHWTELSNLGIPNSWCGLDTGSGRKGTRTLMNKCLVSYTNTTRILKELANLYLLVNEPSRT